jgi:hypothetical protein
VRVHGIGGGTSEVGRTRVVDAVSVGGFLGDRGLDPQGHAIMKGHTPLGSQRGADHGIPRPLFAQRIVSRQATCEQFAFASRQLAIEHR